MSRARAQRGPQNTGGMDVLPTVRWRLFVEGPSDRAAVEALAERLGRRLDRDGVEVVAIGGAHALGRFLADLAPGVRAAGLCDSAEAARVARALERCGIGLASTREELEALGFFVCDPDLEGELIRALGAEGVEAVLAATGKLTAFRTFQKQPQWHRRPVQDQLRRFFGSSAGKARHAPLMVDALPPDRIPRPLAALLSHVATAD